MGPRVVVRRRPGVTRPGDFRRPKAGIAPKTRVRGAEKQTESALTTVVLLPPQLYNNSQQDHCVTNSFHFTPDITKTRRIWQSTSQRPAESFAEMAPTEATILTNYLLVPAQLPAIISLKEFTELFPRAQQSSPQIRKLYRDLQNQRNDLIDEVASNIEIEVKRGKLLRREVLRAKREAEDQEGDDEIDLERAVSVSLLSPQWHDVGRAPLTRCLSLRSEAPGLKAVDRPLILAIQYGVPIAVYHG